MKRIVIFTSLIILVLNSCINKNSKESQSNNGVIINKEYNTSNQYEDDPYSEEYGYPSIKESNSFKETAIVPTLENENLEEKNYIYSASYILAWSVMKQALKSKVLTNNGNSNDFKLINQSTSYINVLKPSEYMYSIDLNDGIKIESSFEKILPFESALDVVDPILFNKKHVKAFGISNYNIDLARTIYIPYYENDNKFIVIIATKDYDHRIIFAKGFNLNKSFLETYNEVTKLIELGKQQKTNKNLWKYIFTQEDILKIPMISFNIKHRFQDINKQNFKTSDNKNHNVNDSYQKIAFNLDQNGVTIRTNSSMSVDSVGFMEDQKPKNLIFDKPFVFFMKRNDADYPYFGIKIRNTELLKE